MMRGLFWFYLILFSAVCYSGEVVLYLPFDEGEGDVAKDLSGCGNDGVLVDSPKWVEGRFGKALLFEGGKRVEVKASDTLHGDIFKEGNFTFTAWIKPTLKGDAWQQILRTVGEMKTAGNDTLFLNVDGRLSWRGFVKGNWTVMCESSPGLLKPESWNHVAVVADGKSFKIFLNGEVVAEKPFQETMGGLEKFCLAFDGRRWVERFSGAMDEVSIWIRPLSEDEIREIMENGVKSVLSVDPHGKLGTIWGNLKAHQWLPNGE